MLLLTGMYTFLGLLLIAVALPMVKRKVPRNPIYGFRTPKTLSRDDIWYKANEYSGRTLVVVGVVTTLTALILAPIPGISKDAYAMLCLAEFVVTMGWSLVTSFRYLNRLK
jgi:uncharacterized membrane protein